MHRHLQTATLQASTGLHLFTSAVSLAGLACLFAAVTAAGSEDKTFLIAVAAAVLLSELFDFKAYAESRVSVSVGLIFAAGVYAGLPGAMVAAGACAAADFAFHRKPAIKAFFNFGSISLTATAFVAVMTLLEGAYAEDDWLAMTGPAMLAAAAAYAVNTGLVSLAISMERGAFFTSVLRDGFVWMAPQFLLFALFAIFAAMMFDRWELAGFALAMAPLAALWLIARMLARRRLSRQPPI